MTTMLSATRQDVLRAILAHQSEHGYAPSIREIGAAIGRSPSSVHRQLRVLENAGYVTRRPSSPRTIEIVGPVTSPG